MCSNYRLKKSALEIAEEFSHHGFPLRFEGGLIPNIEPRDDIRITDRAPVAMAVDGGAELRVLPWSWRGPSGKLVFNYRSEGRRFDTGRCLIMADGFYEYTGAKSPKAKWLFTMADAPLFAIAGLVRDGAFTMLTCEPGPDIALFHDRQIVTLRPADWSIWLNHDAIDGGLLRPSLPGSFRYEQVPPQ